MIIITSVGMLTTVGDGEGVNVGIRDNPRASTDDGDGVDASTKDDPCALTSDGVSLASIGGGDGVGATSRGLTSIDTEDGDGVDDGRISRGGNSLTIYRLFFAVFPFPLDWCDGGRGGSAPPDDISIYTKKIL